MMQNPVADLVSVRLQNNLMGSVPIITANWEADSVRPGGPCHWV